MKRRRDSSPMKEDVPGTENLTEIVQFHEMCKLPGQSLTSFYQDLQDQAAKCGPRYHHELMVRDKLLLCDKNVLKELEGISNPTAETVLEKLATHEDSQSTADSSKSSSWRWQTAKIRELWPVLAPYLSIADVFALSETSTHFARTLKWCINKGMMLTIDSDSLEKYPVEAHRELFSTLGNVSSLTLKRVNDSDFAQILSLYKHISHLKLIEACIIDLAIIPSLPQVTSLELIHSMIGMHIIDQWYNRLNDTLISLKIDYMATDFGSGCLENEFCNFPKLKILHIEIGVPHLEHENQFYLGCAGLESLKIVAKRCQFAPETWHHLENLHFDVPRSGYRDLNFDYFPSLKSLTLKSWPSYDLPTTLEHLKIIEPVDPRLKKQVRDLGIKSTEIFFYDQNEQDNLIVDMLDNDSLIEISKYLSAADSISFAKTDARIYDLIKWHRFTVFKSEHALENSNGSFFKAVAPFINDLCLQGAESSSWLLRYCLSLSALRLHDGKLPPESADKLPHQLDTLEMNRCDLSQYLRRVEGLRVFWFDESSDLDSVKDCLQRNRNSIKEIKLSFNGDGRIIKCIQNQISALQNCTILYVLSREIRA